MTVTAFAGGNYEGIKTKHKLMRFISGASGSGKSFITNTYNTGVVSGWGTQRNRHELESANEKSNSYHDNAIIVAGNFVVYGNNEAEIIISDAIVLKGGGVQEVWLVVCFFTVILVTEADSLWWVCKLDKNDSKIDLRIRGGV